MAARRTISGLEEAGSCCSARSRTGTPRLAEPGGKTRPSRLRFATQYRACCSRCAGLCQRRTCVGDSPHRRRLEPRIGDARGGTTLPRPCVGTFCRPPDSPRKRVDHRAVLGGQPRHAPSLAGGSPHADRFGTRLRHCDVWCPRFQAHHRVADKVRKLAEGRHHTGGLPRFLCILASGGTPADRHDEANCFPVGRRGREPHHRDLSAAF